MNKERQKEEKKKIRSFMLHRHDHGVESFDCVNIDCLVDTSEIRASSACLLRNVNELRLKYIHSSLVIIFVI